MRHGLAFYEWLTILSIVFILFFSIIAGAAALKKNTEKARIGTDTTEMPDAWKTSVNMTPSSPIDTRIVTNPINSQKWLVVTRSNSVSIIPYVPTEVKAEKETK